MRRFSLANPDFEIPPIDQLELEWAGAADRSLARQLGFQVQFAQFFEHLLRNLQSVPSETPNWRPTPLDLSLRAGVIRTYVLLTVSVAEAALAVLGERRQLGRRRDDLYNRTFGALLEVWRSDGQPRQEIEAIWPQLQLLKDVRNYVHLPNAANNDEAYWRQILAREDEIIAASNAVIHHLQNMCHIFRDSIANPDAI